MGILNPAMTFLLRVAIKLTGYGFSRPELLARRIESSLGLNAVSSLFLVLPGSAAVSVLRAYGASIGEHVRVNPPLILQNADEGFGNLSIGDDCHLGSNVLLDLAAPISIGSRVTIAMGSIILTHFDVGDSRLKDSGYSRKEGAVVIADDVFLGAGTIVLAGVSVARRTLVGAGSLMTKSVETSSIVAGVPAKVIKTMPSDRYTGQTS